MNKIAKTLLPFAALAFFGTCLVTFLGLLVVSLTSVGLAEEIPLSYYYRLNIPVLSVALPIAGMIFFTAILLGTSGKPAEAAESPVVEDAKTLPAPAEVKKEESLAKAA